MIKRIEKAYNEGLEKGYGKKGAIILSICAVLGLIIGYFGALALEGAILMWVFNLLAPLVGVALVLTFWQGVAIIVAWRILKAAFRGLFKK
jgi:hypothetical protein